MAISNGASRGEKMGASRNNDRDQKAKILNPGRENSPFKTITSANGETRNTNNYLADILTIIPSDGISHGNYSDLDLGLGIESEPQQTNVVDWEFDSHRADL